MQTGNNGWQQPQQPPQQQPQQPWTPPVGYPAPGPIQQAEEPVPLWHRFLYSFGMLFAAKAVDKLLEPKPVWRKHPGKVAAFGVLAAGFLAFLGWKATRPLE